MKKIIFVILLLALISSGCGGDRETYSKTDMIMGTFIEIKIFDKDKSLELVRLTVDNALMGAKNLQEKFDIYNPESEINRLNLYKKEVVSNDILVLLRLSQDISKQTDGRFDVTVAPILKKEGFYEDMPEEILGKIPDNYDGVGWENVVIDPQKQIVELKNNAWIDLSGVAKGYIVDNIARFLMSSGYKNILINAGGDIYATEKFRNKGWTIGLRKPGSEKMLMVLDINKKAVATSGDYENVVEGDKSSDAKSHIIDPVEKRAKEVKNSSVTVIAQTCTYADALSTAFMTMTKDEAINLANKLENVEIIGIYSEGKDTRVAFSANAESYVTRR